MIKSRFKLISFVLALVIVFSLLPQMFFADNEETTVVDYIDNGNMSETTNGALTYWSPDLGTGTSNDTVGQRSYINYGGVTINQYDGYFAAIRNLSYDAFEAGMHQLMILIPDGTYTLSAYVYSSVTEADKESGAYAKMYAYANDGNDKVEIDLPDATSSGWTRVTIPNITITNGKCRIGFEIKSIGGSSWAALAIDDVKFALPSSTLNGTVKDANGSNVANAEIKVQLDGEIVASATTNSSGNYGSLTVPSGDGYTITASAAGYRDVTVEDISFDEFESYTQDLTFGTPIEENAYYFDAENGNDSNDGRTPATAWKSISKFNATTFIPGDNILFKAGSTWEGATLIPKGNGTEDAPIYIGKYGDENLYPSINANYVPGTDLSSMTTTNLNALEITGVSYWEINDLELTNYSVYNDDMTLTEQQSRRAVTITSSGGTMYGIKLNGLYIHDVNGWNPKSNYNGCGISLGASGQTYIDGLTIENCLLQDITRDGITGGGYTGTRPWGWDYWDQQNGTPIRHQNVVIRNNVLDNIAGDGIVVTGTIDAVVEYNLGTNICSNPIKYPSMSGNAQSNLSAAFWAFDADNTVFQYNEVAYTGAPRGTEVADGEAFDSDYYCVNTTFQYNYTHDNEGGFLMICGPAYAYNDGTVVRYNISENDGSLYGKRTIFQIGGGGGVDNSYIYNNTIFTDEDHAVFSVVNGEPWDGNPQGTHFYNNIFNINGTVGEFGFGGNDTDKGKDGIVTYSNNLYYGSFFISEDGELNLPKDMPEDENAVYGDPLLLNPGTAGDGYENAVVYQIQEGSAAIGQGLIIDQSWLGQKLSEKSYTAGNGSTAENKAVYFHVEGEEFQWHNTNGGIDFFGNVIPEDTAPDIGAHQLSLKVEVDKSALLEQIKIAYEINDNLDNYEEEGQSDFISALEYAESIYDSSIASQDEVDKAASELEYAISQMKLIDDTGSSSSGSEQPSSSTTSASSEQPSSSTTSTESEQPSSSTTSTESEQPSSSATSSQQSSSSESSSSLAASDTDSEESSQAASVSNDTSTTSSNTSSSTPKTGDYAPILVLGLVLLAGLTIVSKKRRSQ